VIAQTLSTAADYASGLNRLELAARLSDEALGWATRSGDAWEIASALRSRARGARSLADLPELVDAAAGPLEEVGNRHQLADLLTSAAYAAVSGGGDELALSYAERATDLVRMLGDRWLRLVTAGNRGLALLFTGDVAGACSAFREELALVGELVVIPIAQEALLGLAAVAVEEGDLHRAAILSGSAGATDQEPQTVDVVARIEERFLRPARDAFGDAAWEAGVREGAGLGFEAAVTYGLEEPMTAGVQSER
jgi:hypothetical protein